MRILDIGFNDKYFERAIHHEIFHLIKDSNKNLFDESIWSKFNDEKFNYAECSTCTDKLNLDTYKKTNGFFSEYSKSTASEDMAEVFSHLLIGEKAILVQIPSCCLNSQILELVFVSKILKDPSS